MLSDWGPFPFAPGCLVVGLWTGPERTAGRVGKVVGVRHYLESSPCVLVEFPAEDPENRRLVLLWCIVSTLAPMG